MGDNIGYYGKMMSPDAPDAEEDVSILGDDLIVLINVTKIGTINAAKKTIDTLSIAICQRGFTVHDVMDVADIV